MSETGASGIRRIVAQGASVAATRVVLIGAAFVISIVVARALPIEERGRFGLLMTTAVLAIQFGNCGVANANTYLVARRRELTPAVVANTSRFMLAMTVLLGGLGVACVLYFPALAPLRGVAGLASWLVAVTGLIQLLTQNLLVGQSQFSIYNRVDVLSRVGAIAAMAVLWVLGGTTAFWFGVATGVFYGVSSWWGLRTGRLQVTIHGWDAALARTQVRMGARAYVSCLALFALGRLPLYVVEARTGLRGLAFFSQALLVTEAMLVLPGALGTVLLPSLASLPDAAARVRATLRMAGGTALLMLVAAAAAACLGPWLLPHVYGRAYAASMPFLLVMLPGVVSLGICSVLQNALSANGFPWASVAGPVVGLVAVVVTLYTTHDALGCGWAYSIGGVVMLAASSVAWWLNRHHQIDVAPGARLAGSQ